MSDITFENNPVSVEQEMSLNKLKLISPKTFREGNLTADGLVKLLDQNGDGQASAKDVYLINRKITEAFDADQTKNKPLLAPKFSREEYLSLFSLADKSKPAVIKLDDYEFKAENFPNAALTGRRLPIDQIELRMSALGRRTVVLFLNNDNSTASNAAFERLTNFAFGGGIIEVAVGEIAKADRSKISDNFEIEFRSYDHQAALRLVEKINKDRGIKVYETYDGPQGSIFLSDSNRGRGLLNVMLLSEFEQDLKRSARNPSK